MNESKRHSSGFVWRLAAAMGIVWGLCMLCTAITAIYTTTYAHKMVEVFASIYFGYGPTWGGALLGLVWGFMDVFLGTLLVVGVYRLLGCGCCCGGGEDEGGGKGGGKGEGEANAPGCQDNQ